MFCRAGQVPAERGVRPDDPRRDDPPEARPAFAPEFSRGDRRERAAPRPGGWREGGQTHFRVVLRRPRSTTEPGRAVARGAFGVARRVAGGVHALALELSAAASRGLIDRPDEPGPARRPGGGRLVGGSEPRPLRSGDAAPPSRSDRGARAGAAARAPAARPRRARHGDAALDPTAARAAASRGPSVSRGRRNTSTVSITSAPRRNQPRASVAGSDSARTYSQPSRAAALIVSASVAANSSAVDDTPLIRFSCFGAGATL